MYLLTAAYLMLSISFSVGRNILSKSVSEFSPKTKCFYYLQFTIFLAGILPLLFVKNTFSSVSLITLILSVIYGILLISAQWNYTIALKNGNTGVCSTVYSLGFIFPTMQGMIFWNEEFSIIRLFGIALAIPAIIISGKKTDKTKTDNSYIIPLILAMLSSGGLGIMQKIQQSTEYPEQKSGFILIAFATASLISLTKSIFTKNKGAKVSKKHLIYACFIGLCFSICNLLNTILAGLLDSAVFFPILNIGTILLSLVLSIIIFKEKLNNNSITVLLLGIASIVLINI